MTREAFVRQLGRAAPWAALSDAQIHALWQHYQLLSRWNARINLTRVIELEEAVRFHYAESLYVAGLVPPAATTLADLGSGAGFPGFVIAVARPELRVALVESDQRKAAFLREASDLAPNVRVLAKRSREVEGRFDVVVSRAVRAEEVLELAGRSARWVVLVGTEPAGRGMSEWRWETRALPDGKGLVWVGERLAGSHGGGADGPSRAGEAGSEAG